MSSFVGLFQQDIGTIVENRKPFLNISPVVDIEIQNIKIVDNPQLNDHVTWHYIGKIARYGHNIIATLPNGPWESCTYIPFNLSADRQMLDPA